jgi:hypothetical protein
MSDVFRIQKSGKAQQRLPVLLRDVVLGITIRSWEHVRLNRRFGCNFRGFLHEFIHVEHAAAVGVKPAACECNVVLASAFYQKKIPKTLQGTE